MKKVYWRPRTVSRTALLLVAILAVAGLLIAEFTKTEQTQRNLVLKTEAAELAQRAMDEIKRVRVTGGPPIDVENDPFETGLIGLPTSTVTSVHGVLEAKQASINPNFAAVILEMLLDSGVQEGDPVAMGLSGSFPALNICAIAACETIGAEPLIISSASASEWGANVPDLMWVDMEHVLNEKGILHCESLAASLGGEKDKGPKSKQGRDAVIAGIRRNELQLIDEPTIEEHVDARIRIYEDKLRGREIKAYINVGGGATSVGTHIGKDLFNPGLNMVAPQRVHKLPGVMPRLSRQGVPCIHIINIVTLAERYGLITEPTSNPDDPNPPPYVMRREIGKAGIYERVDYRREVVAAVLATILLALWGFIRTDLGFRLLRGGSARKASGPPEPMV